MAGRTGGRGARRRSRPSLDEHTIDRAREIGPILLVAVLAMAVLAGLAVLPARTWLSQREAMNDARAELQQIEADVDDLEAQLELLQTDDEVERLARQHFDLVYPGDESYRIVTPDG
ncbi:MAG: septum formation initiator family protein [Acidimicrobiales bacterium]